MAQRHYYRDIDGTLTDMSAYAPRLNWIAQSKAEEGAYGSWTVTLDDPNGELNLVGHRQWFVEDDESDEEDDIIFGGFTGGQTFSRVGEDGKRKVGPEARVIDLDLIDANTWFSKILLRGALAKRPIETDVARMQALLASPQAAQIIDTTTYVDTSGPITLDKADLRGVYFGQAVGDCASASGKNYFLWYAKVGGIRTLTIWYGKDTLPDYPSPFYITNDAPTLRGEGVDPYVGPHVVPLSADAKMIRSPERQYCGNYATYGDKNAAIYRHSAANHAIIGSYGSGHRDMTSSWPLVKTKAKAIARADRQLTDVHPQDIRVTTKLVDIPSTRVTQAKAGMRLQILGTHLYPNLDTWHYARIVTAQPKPHAKGELFDIDLELVVGDEADGPPAPVPPENPSDLFGQIMFAYGYPNLGGGHGILHYAHTGDTPPGGWSYLPITGGIAYDQVAKPFSSMTISDPGNVRIWAKAWYSANIGHVPGTMRVFVNGVLVGSDTSTMYSNLLVVDIRNYHLDAGDVVSVDSDVQEFWSNNGNDNSFLRVVRGTFGAIVGP